MFDRTSESRTSRFCGLACAALPSRRGATARRGQAVQPGARLLAQEALAAVRAGLTRKRDFDTRTARNRESNGAMMQGSLAAQGARRAARFTTPSNASPR